MSKLIINIIITGDIVKFGLCGCLGQTAMMGHGNPISRFLNNEFWIFAFN